MPETVVHFQIRMPPDLYETLVSWAKDDKVSLNALVVETLQEAWRITNRTTRRNMLVPSKSRPGQGDFGRSGRDRSGFRGFLRLRSLEVSGPKRPLGVKTT